MNEARAGGDAEGARHRARGPVSAFTAAVDRHGTIRAARGHPHRAARPQPRLPLGAMTATAAPVGPRSIDSASARAVGWEQSPQALMWMWSSPRLRPTPRRRWAYRPVLGWLL